MFVYIESKTFIQDDNTICASKEKSISDMYTCADNDDDSDNNNGNNNIYYYYYNYYNNNNYEIIGPS